MFTYRQDSPQERQLLGKLEVEIDSRYSQRMQPCRTTCSSLSLPVLGLLLTSLTAGCSLLFGTIEAPSKKSEFYSLPDLRITDHWSAPTLSTDVNDPDRVYRHVDGSTMSLTSICRPRHRDGTRTLRDYRQELFTGFDSSTILQESSPPSITPQLTRVSPTPEQLLSLAQTQSRGTLLTVKLLQLRQRSCIYDLMLIAREQKFPLHEAEFDRFAGSLQFLPHPTDE